MNTTLSRRSGGSRRGSARVLSAVWPTLAFFALLAFDFRAEVGEGGSFQQYLVFLGAVGAGVAGTWRLLLTPIRRWQLPVQVWLLVAMVITALVLFPLRQAAWSDFLRLYTPYVLCLLGALLAVVVARQQPVVQGHVLTGLLVIGLISAAWTFFFGSVIRGLDLMEGRYFLVATITPQLFAIALLMLAYPLPNLWLAGVVVLVSLLLIVISITRTYLLVAAVILAFYLWVLALRGLSLKSLRTLIAAVVLIVVGVAGTIVVFPEFADRWSERMFNEATEEGEQRTAITREAEWVNQLKQLRDSPRALVMGQGLGARYYWDEGRLSRLPDYRDMPEFREGMAEAGHSYWIYSVFSGGLVTGWIMPLLLLWTMAQGALILVRMRRAQAGREGDPRLLWDLALGTMYYSAVLATFALSFTSTPFVSRIASALFGFVVAASVCHLAQAKARRII